MKAVMQAGLVGEFETAEGIVRAAHELRKLGYRSVDAFTPFPMLEVERAIGLRRSRLGWVIFPCALAGALLAYLLQWWTSAIDYPLDVGGRPPHSSPAFIPITFEMCVLASGLSALVALVVASGWPRLWQPVFEVRGFERASIDRFFLAVSAFDPAFDREVTAAHLASVGAMRVEAVGPLDDAEEART
jgi:hypothetical protein